MKPGVAGDHLLNFLDRGIVVHIGLYADPKLGEVRSDNFVGSLRPTDVRAKISNTGNRQQFIAGANRDSPHGLKRGSRLLHPVHQEVGLFKVWQELPPESGNSEQTQTHADQQKHDSHGGFVHGPLEKPAIHLLKPPCQGTGSLFTWLHSESH